MTSSVDNPHPPARMAPAPAAGAGVRQRGVAMLLVLIAVAIATILSMSFLSSQATSMGVAQNVQGHAQARSVAESALVVAINYVQTDADWRTDKSEGQWVSSASFNGGTFDLYAYDGLDTDGDGVVDDTDGDLSDDASDPVTLKVVGEADGVSHTVFAAVTAGEAETGLNVLMVVGNASSLNSRDNDKKDLMEGWGMTVTLLSDEENQSAYDAAAALVDVIYVAESSNSSTVGSKTTAMNIGVVTDEPYLYDELEVTSSNGSSFSDDQLDIVDNSHYITSTIDSGDMDNFSYTTTTETMYYASGTMASGATVLATRDSNSNPVIVAVEAGATLEDGSSAAGRRVLLPTAGSFDMDYLTAAGETIMERSLRWAGSGSVSTGVVYEGFSEAKASSNTSSITVSTPADTTEGDLLIAAVATDSSESLSDSGWTQIAHDNQSSVTLGVWWKLAGASESASHTFTWGSSEEAYAYIMRFTGHHPTTPIDASATHGGSSNSPTSPAVTTTVDNAMVLRIGGFDDDDVSTDSTGLTGHATITMDESGSGSGTASGGAGYVMQATAGDSGSSSFSLTNSEQYRTVTVAIAPDDSAGGGGSGNEPNRIVLYEFIETPPPAPALVGQWALDEAGSGSSSAYDFSSGSPGSDIWAYDGQSSSAPPSNVTTPSSELSAGEYTDISTENSSSHSVATTSNGRHPMMRYAFEIAEAEAGVSEINVSWIGRNTNAHGPRTDGAELYIWNYNSGGYEQLDVSGDTESEVTLSGSISSNLPDYIGGASDNTITILAQSRDKRTANKSNILYTDYVSITISASLTASDTVSANDGAGSGGVVGSAGGNGDGMTSFDFDGVDARVEVTHADTYLLDDGSVSFWFNSDDLTGHHALLSKDSNDFDTGGHLHIYTDGSTLTARIQDATSSSYALTSSGLSTSTWYHVVVSWGAGGFKMFRNGVEVDADSYTGGLGTNSGGAGNYEAMLFGAGTWNSDDLVATPTNNYFDGRIDDVRIYDGGFNATQANNVYGGSAPGVGDATTVYDTSGYGTPLDLQIEDYGNVTWVGGGGLTLDSATRIVSSSAATKLYDALTATDQFSLEVIFTPTNTSQSGPARIVSYSDGSASRNVTFGQDGDEFITRLRTSGTTSNGTPSADSGSALATGTQAHVIVSYDGENITMYQNGGSNTTLARTGTLSWDNSFNLMFGNETIDGYDWLGTLHLVAVYDKAFNQVQADNVFGGGEPGDGTGGVVNSVDWIER